MAKIRIETYDESVRVRKRDGKWEGTFRWRAFDEEGPMGPKRLKSVTLRRDDGTAIPRPTSSKPDRGSQTARRALRAYVDRFRDEHAALMEAKGAKADDRELEKRASAALDEGTLEGQPPEVLAKLEVGDFVDFVIGRDALLDGLAERTVASYRGLNDNHIRPAWRHRTVDSVTTQDIEAFKMALERRHDAGPGMGQSVMRKIWVLLKQAFSEAERMGVVKRSPFDAMRRGRGIANPKPNPHPLAEESFQRLCALLDAVPRPTAFSVSVELALQAGLRVGEVSGLKWADVDFTLHEIRIMKQADPHGGRADPKSAAGVRRVPMTPDLERVLATWKRQREEDFAPYGVAPGDAWYVLSDVNNNQRRTYLISKEWKAYAEANSLMDITGNRCVFHGLRDTWVTKMLEATAQIEAVSKMAGHARASFTLDVYGASMPHTERESIIKAASSLRPHAAKEPTAPEPPSPSVPKGPDERPHRDNVFSIRRAM